jgi:hypothetical protein
MSKNILKRSLVILPLLFAGISAQDKVDAIEAARQAKAAAEKAAADAEAATEAAIEAAAEKAAKEAREKVKQDKLDEEARKKAEKEAAEAAELDAAAAAAAEEAKRKMAEELGLEYESPGSTETSSPDQSLDETILEEEVSDSTEEVTVKESLGYKVGFTGSVGFINGAYITNTPVGGSLVVQSPFGFKLGKSLNLKVSFAGGSYNGEGNDEPLDALFLGLGANATLFEFVFSETHLGFIGAGLGIRSFSGVSLEKILNKGLNLPVNILVGAEGFLATKADDIAENSTYWGGLGIRLDYAF